MATASAPWSIHAKMKLARVWKLRLICFKVREQLARCHPRHFRRCRLLQRREQRFDSRLELSESREYAVVLRDAKLRRIWSCFGPTGITGGARDSTQHVQQFHFFLFHLVLLINLFLQLSLATVSCR